MRLGDELASRRRYDIAHVCSMLQYTVIKKALTNHHKLPFKLIGLLSNAGSDHLFKLFKTKLMKLNIPN
ncbi:hypothetical protein XELAEV_18039928mg [Xenopus laevis]|uniref:Uncharacterized protein n=1 Tax=Xenopus laevis TaxID=8355 RepID=A0A974C9R5_XENLA|nr:hypothetical protein XELAEV_18039928mg [Xenopus laevis]